jgi:hypothetical protein
VGMRTSSLIKAPFFLLQPLPYGELVQSPRC